MTEPIIRMSGVHKTYAMDGVQVHALRGIDLVVESGEFIAIMGASGSGKSTLMHILGCLDIPDAGKYWLNGEDVTRLDTDALAGIRNRAVGFVFQNFNLLARTSALDNVEMPLVYAGIDRQTRHARAHTMLERMGLGDRLMRHAIARARDRGCGLVQLTSDKERADAHRFYERLGFRATHDGMKLVL